MRAKDVAKDVRPALELSGDTARDNESAGGCAPARQFISVNDMPDDLFDAFEQMKLVVLRHRAEGWQEITADQMIQVLYVLQRMAMEASA